MASVPRYSNFILRSHVCHLCSRRNAKYQSITEMIDIHAESKKCTLRVSISRLTRSSHRVAWAHGQSQPDHGQTIDCAIPALRDRQESLGATLWNLYCGIRVRMVAGLAEGMERKEVWLRRPATIRIC